MLYTCIVSNKFDLIQATRVSHKIQSRKTSLLWCWINYGRKKFWRRGLRGEFSFFFLLLLRRRGCFDGGGGEVNSSNTALFYKHTMIVNATLELLEWRTKLWRHVWQL
jgi:hypothetical protein